LQQVRVYKHAQLSAVTKGMHAMFGLGNPLRTIRSVDSLPCSLEHLCKFSSNRHWLSRGNTSTSCVSRWIATR
jgi:hypothetical protein